MPSRKGVRALKPNCSLARSTSSRRRGWPFGFDVVPDDLAGVAGRIGDRACELANRDLVAGAEVHRVCAVVLLRRQRQALGAILDVQELPRRRAVTPEHDRLVAALAGLEHLPDQGRDHMRALEVEVVARPVEVHRQQVDRVQPVLLAVPLRPDQQRLLGDPVGRVRLLGVSVPEVFLAEGHGGELGIGADRSDDDQLVDGGEPALLEHVRAHEEVRVPVAARVGAICADAADLAGKVEHEVRRSVGKQACRVLGERQVIVATARDKGVVPLGAKPLDEVRAEESAPAGDEDLHAADTSRVGISVVTVAYGAGPSLARLLDSLAGEADEVVVVDNGEGGEEIADAGAREGVSVVSPGENLGFAAGSNRGAREAAGDVLVFLNPDTVVAPGALDSLRRTLEDRSIGIAMARLRLLARPELLNSRGTEVHVSGIGWAAGYGEPVESVRELREIAAPSGAAMAIRAETFRSLGGFAEELFMYLEDVELGWRAHLAGLRVVVDPEADVFHEYDFGRNPRKNYFIERNRLFFCLTAFSPRLLALLSPGSRLDRARDGGGCAEGGLVQGQGGGLGLVHPQRPGHRSPAPGDPAAAQGPRP